jgi:hypothetical protein
MAKRLSRAWDQQIENPQETARLEREKQEQAQKQKQKEQNSKKK